MLRTMGSTLLAKASPGGAFRKTDEANIESPAIPGKGAIGTISRAGLEEPIERQVPAGSTKVVSSSPTIESELAPSGVLPQQPIGQGIGLPQPGSPLPSTPRSGAGAPPPPNVGLTQPTLRSAAGKTGAQASGGAIAGAGVASAYRPQETAPVNVQGEVGDRGNSNIISAISGNVGGKTIASEPGRAISAPSQTRSGAANIAGMLGAPSGVVRSIARTEPIGNAVRSAVGAIGNYNPVTTTAKAANAVVNQIKSGGAIGQAAQKVSGWLRSLFR